MFVRFGRDFQETNKLTLTRSSVCNSNTDFSGSQMSVRCNNLLIVSQIGQGQTNS